MNSTLERAQQALDEHNSAEALSLVEGLLATNPSDEDALIFHAKVVGWNSQKLTLDTKCAVQAAQEVIAKINPPDAYELGKEIYLARKNQIARMLDVAYLSPSYSGAKNLHAVMLTWLELLKTMPSLPADVIEDEINICEQLCVKSKRGVMPTERLIYTAYASLNGKKSYGQLFKEELQGRIAQGNLHTQQILKDISNYVDNLQDPTTLPEFAAQSPEQQKQELQMLLLTLENHMATLNSLTNKLLYQQQRDEAAQKLAALKPYKLRQKAVLSDQIAALDAKLEEIETLYQPYQEPLNNWITTIQSYLA